MRGFYSLLLYLFPKSYRDEYGDELQAVFDLLFADAMRSGAMEVMRVTLRELFSLPMAIIHEYLRERRKTSMIRKFGSYFDFSKGSHREFLTALYPFILVGILLPLMDFLTMSNVLIPRSRLVNGIGIFLVVSLGGLFLVGLVAGLPRWSLPYIGFAGAIFSVWVFSNGMDLTFRHFPRLYQRLLSLGDVFLEGTIWFGLLVVMVLLVILTTRSSMFQRFREDWTLPCFIPYGAVLFALMLTFDEYRSDEPFMLLSSLVLAVGAWFYLRDRDEWKRFGVLFGGLTLAMFIAAAGKAILLPVQDWPGFIDPALWRSEALRTIITWMWLVLILCIPLIIRSSPRSQHHLQPTDTMAG